MTAILPTLSSVETDTVEWAAFYAEWESRGRVPAPSIRIIEKTRAIFQAMFLDLGEVKAALLASGFAPRQVTVLADVLKVPPGVSLTVDGVGWMVQARALQLVEPFQVTVDFRTSSSSLVALYYAQQSAPVRLVAAPPDGPPQVFTVARPSPAGGVMLRMTDQKVVKEPVTWAQGASRPATDWFARAMRTEFLFATLLYDSRPELAISQFTWLKNWTGNDENLIGLFLQSTSLLALLTAQVNAASDGTVFVPYLSRSIYQDLARAYVAEAQQYESDFRALQTQRVVDDQFLQLAKVLLANKLHESDYADQLLAQAKRNFDNASAAVDKARVTLVTAQRDADLVRIDFTEIGIPEWRRQQIIKAIIDIASAVVTFGAGIATVVAGNPAGGAAAVGGGIAAAKAAQAAAGSGSTLAELAKQLVQVMTELKEILEALDKVVELSRTLVAASLDIEHAGSYAEKLRALDADTKGADLTATYEWTIYQQAADSSLQEPVELKIRFAKELKLAVDGVAVYGQALAAAQVAAIQAGQQYAGLRLQGELARKEVAELTAYVNSLTRGAAVPEELMQRFYAQYLGAKAGLFAAAQQYRASYYYWALQPSLVNPTIVDGVEQLGTGLDQLTAMALDYANALTHFDPPPERMVDKQVVIDDPAVLTALTTTGQANWVVPLDSRTFAGYDRVRLDTVRVWLDGSAIPEGEVRVRMRTQGSYLDRLAGKGYQFTAKPLDRTFEYRVTRRRQGPPAWVFANGALGYIQVDGVVDDEVSYAYFQPTPMAQWEVGVRVDGERPRGVQRVVMQFAGSVIPRAGRPAGVSEPL